MMNNDQKYDRFKAWCASREAAGAELITGIRTRAGHLPLDRSGLAARGWSEVPVDFVPENNGILIGGYLEDRDIYNSPVFRSEGSEPRTLHLGLDVFAAADTSVYAPLDGHVHSFQMNAGELDYGPTIILEHSPEPDLTFWTLYGHLSEESLAGLEVGYPVSVGEKLAELGDPTVNGGWAPHLHFQIMLDLQGRSGDFPGVCKLSEKETWAAICPDPRPFLGLPVSA